MIQLNVKYLFEEENIVDKYEKDVFLLELKPYKSEIDKFIYDSLVLNSGPNSISTNLIKNITSNILYKLQEIELALPLNTYYFHVKLYSSNFIYNYVLLQNIPDALDAQLKKDLHRTLTESKVFQEKEKQNQLYRLLKALAVLDNELEYCQGMNLLVCLVLYVSFYVLISLFSNTFSCEINITNLYSK